MKILFTILLLPIFQLVLRLGEKPSHFPSTKKFVKFTEKQHYIHMQEIQFKQKITVIPTTVKRDLKSHLTVGGIQTAHMFLQQISIELNIKLVNIEFVIQVKFLHVTPATGIREFAVNIYLIFSLQLCLTRQACIILFEKNV